MVAAWFGGVEEQGLRQQEWFIHIASGGSIRDLDAPIKLTRRMAHLFQRSPQLGSVEKSMRWAQVLGMGGNGPLAQATLKTRLGRNFENDEFWSTVVLFLVNNAMLDPTWVGPIVDYVHNMKFAPRRIVQEGGGLEEEPPPQPNFTMKGRSATKLLRQVEAWHGHLSREEYVNFQSWQPCGIRPWELEGRDGRTGQGTVDSAGTVVELGAGRRRPGNAPLRGLVFRPVRRRQHRDLVDLRAARRSRGTGARADGRAGHQEPDGDSGEGALQRGKVPNKPPKSGKVRSEVQGGYLRLLDRSEHVMQEWMQRERLAPRRLTSALDLPADASVRPILVCERLLIQFVPMNAPLGHEPVHQLAKTLVVVALDQVDHFVDED